MNKEMMELYANLEQQKREIETRQAEIKENALAYMHENKADKVESDFGSFKIVVRKTWKYTDVVKKLEEDVKTLKKTQEENGDATAEAKESVTFYPAKN